MEAMKEKKIISVSDKRQITIPLNFFKELNIGDNVECEIDEDKLILRPINTDSGDYFSDIILDDLIKRGYKGKELLSEFTKQRLNIRKAVKKIISEADEAAKNEKETDIDNLFGDN
jgi:bifunctional DNA-binding transcriptional regulator/antitoxin component of YhaV-PrlF toxin-antitoxin module